MSVTEIRHKKKMHVDLHWCPDNAEEIAGEIIRNLELEGRECTVVSAGMFPVIRIDGADYATTLCRHIGAFAESTYAVLTLVS